MKMFELLLFCLYLHLHVFGDIKITKGKEVTALSQQLVYNNYIRNENSRGKLDCVVRCEKDDVCNAVSYNSVTKICRFYGGKLTASDGGTHESNWRSYNVYPEWCPVHDGFMYDEVSGICLRAFLEGVTLNCSAAVSFCEQHGARLPIIDTIEKDQFLFMLYGHYGFHGTFFDCYKVGSIWYWQNGAPIANGYTDWSPGEPNSGESCVGIQSTYGLQWRDYESYFLNDAVCEIRK